MRLKSIGVLITNGFQNLLCVFVNIILNMFVPKLVFFHNFVIVSSQDDLSEERSVV